MGPLGRGCRIRADRRRVIRDHPAACIIGCDPAAFRIHDDAQDLGPHRCRGHRHVQRFARHEAFAGVQLHQELLVHVKALGQLLLHRGKAHRRHLGLFGVVVRDALDQPARILGRDRVGAGQGRARMVLQQRPDLGVKPPVLRQAVHALEGTDGAFAHAPAEAVHHARRHARAVQKDLDLGRQRRLARGQLARASVGGRLDVRRHHVDALVLCQGGQRGGQHQRCGGQNRQRAGHAAMAPSNGENHHSQPGEVLPRRIGSTMIDLWQARRVTLRRRGLPLRGSRA